MRAWQEKKKKELKRTKNYLVGGWKRILPLIEQIHSDKLSVQSLIGDTPKAHDASIPFSKVSFESEAKPLPHESSGVTEEINSMAVLELVDDNFLESTELKDLPPRPPKMASPREQAEEDEPSKPLFVKNVIEPQLHIQPPK